MADLERFWSFDLNPLWDFRKPPEILPEDALKVKFLKGIAVGYHLCFFTFYLYDPYCL